MMQGLLEIRVTTCRLKQVVAARASKIELKAKIDSISIKTVASHLTPINLTLHNIMKYITFKDL